MKDKEYDFSKGKRGQVVKTKGKTRITIYLDNDVIEKFRKRSDAAGYGYQTMINEALREYLYTIKSSQLFNEDDRLLRFFCQCL